MLQSIAIPKPPRFHYVENLGWVVDTTIGLTIGQMIKCVEFVKKVQLKRANQLGPGDMRDQILRRLSELDPKTVQQNLIGSTPWQVEKYPFLKR